MKKKMLAIVSVIVVLFLALVLINQLKDKKALDDAGNPTGSKQTEQSNEESTVKQTDESLYDNQIKPEELNKLLDEKEDVTVYFYSPECSYCLETTPILVPLAEKLDIDVKKINVLEYQEAWDKYKLDGTPTLIHYKDGEETGRIDGYHEEEEFQSFFDEYVLEEK
ncbi:thioredoxin family protein [Cerasibacillus terrae]|uniref:Thioredoxin family protein n=1 Tax=Cerasibacillus terrae TaxID=2498845 RepID=A0A5C8NQH7_9BACI|nr:thioredoxin family protein [Cerasibacillus terrae]TXL63999.1 thioredoxin family protein [Cerasibacillus terrae]